MKVHFRESFVRDLGAIRNASLRERVTALIETVEQAQSLADIPNLRRLRGGGEYYRLRVGEYRAGLVIDDTGVTFVRFLHRRDIYRRFP